MNAYFDRFTISLTKSEALSASHPGPCDDDVARLCALPHIARQLDAIHPAKIVAELREYGAWDDTELSDVQANRRRIVWLAAGNIREELLA